MPIKGPTACWSPSPTAAAPFRGCHHRPHQPGKGLAIHQESCRNIRATAANRTSTCRCGGEVDKDQEQEFRTGISIEIVNHLGGALAELANVIAATGANIHAISTEEKDARVYVVTLLITTKSRSTLPTSCARSG